ncbi:MAG: hypothetical protein ACYSWP_09045 [Planctomycetota bacterium]|jgi:hypothetical protein
MDREDKDSKSQQVKGKWWISWPAILVAACVFLFLGSIFLIMLINTGNSSWGPARWIRRIREPLPPPLGWRFRGSRVVCGTNVSGIVKSMIVYANDDELGRLLPADKWCDLLIGRDYTSAKQFICRQSDAIEGESAYAININAAGKSLSSLPPDMVLVFETRSGRDRKGRQEPLKNRAFYKMTGWKAPDKKVYKNRWNQTGGIEIADTSHRKGYINVGFVNTRVKAFRLFDLRRLQWKPDPNSSDLSPSEAAKKAMVDGE